MGVNIGAGYVEILLLVWYRRAQLHAVMLCLDIFQTFDLEKTAIWDAHFSWTSTLYILNRYGTFISMIAQWSAAIPGQGSPSLYVPSRDFVLFLTVNDMILDPVVVRPYRQWGGVPPFLPLSATLASTVISHRCHGIEQCL